MAVIMNPKLLESSNIMKEAKEKANQYLKIKGFNVGAYSDSKGLPIVRKNLAKWYKERDGYDISEDSIYLTNGGINAYDHIISLICETDDCVILPNPCYPLYENYNKASCVQSLFYSFEGMSSGQPTGEIEYDSLTRTLNESRSKGKNVKALVVINPHNPLGFVLKEDQMEKIIKFCEEYSLVLIAVETLQNTLLNGNSKQSSEINVQDSEGNILQKEAKFKSFRYIVNKTKSQVELFSIYSISKGLFFNQGIRAGILDFMNIDVEVEKQLYKYKSIDLCSGVPGQIFMDLSLNIPKEFGYEFQFNFERSLVDFKKSLYDAKLSMQKKIQTDGIFVPREIEAGYSFFLKIKNSSKNFGNEAVSGETYGHGLKDYYNFYINL